MWDWFINFLANVLQHFANFAGDWGVAIIILTVIMRLLVMPLMTKSTASSARMQALQPKMKEIQERYADDPERQAEEMRKFYSENKFNPLGGCLPILIQMPVFFALFTVARDFVPSDAHFLNIIPSLSTSAASAFGQFGIAGSWIYILFDVAFGVLTLIPMVMNLAIGTITPPVGSVLFVGCSLANLKVEKVMKQLIPYFVAILIALLLVTFIPALCEWLPTAFGLM